ncbi:uncharacterized protein LOC129597651 [Paramacrobiotus metropolitanus]|uniref:uncharacterized protein LOC129597651 n=1 Tax=Paramacrobiotus metropolitanus TaxID=2943436 RepID=UPI0024464CF9|nr:uncharacterized protein LOC129597651 [Paramacrobiotus metropolitanus]
MSEKSAPSSSDGQKRTLSEANLASTSLPIPGKSATKTPPAKKAKVKTPKGSKRNPLNVDQLMEKLKNAGVDNLEKVSGCVKAGIAKGLIKLDSPADLDKVIATAVCSEILPSDCNHLIKATLKMAMHQKDWGGDEYNFVSYEHPVTCGGCGEGYFVSWVCSGKPDICYSKYMSHCNKCPNFGVCIGECREIHCDNCGQHYYAGSQKQMPCSCDPRLDEMMFGRGPRR